MVKPQLLWNCYKEAKDNSFTVVFPKNYFLPQSLTTAIGPTSVRKQMV